MKNVSNLLCIIIFGVFLIYNSITLWSDGMFMDGLMYAGISENLSNDVGSFWYLKLTDFLHPNFHEHPPLAFGLQSIWFDLFGESRFVERFYSIFTYVLTSTIMLLIWRRVTGAISSQYKWISLAVWITIFLVNWSISNNMLENTMMVFTSLSVFFMIGGVNKNRLMEIMFGGIMIFCAFLTKGFVGLFPLSFLFWYWVIVREYTFLKMFKHFIIVIASIFIPLLFIYLFSESGIESMLNYINAQVIRSVTTIQTVDSRFFIVRRMILELLPAIILMVIFIVRTKIYGLKTIVVERENQWAKILMLVALSGVLPIMISLKQSAFYMLASFPLFSIAFGLFLVPYLRLFGDNWGKTKSTTRILQFLSVFVFVIGVGLALMSKDKIGRDEKMIHDVYATIDIVQPNNNISIADDLVESWNLHCYLQRYGHIGISKIDINQRFPFLLVKRSSYSYPIPVDYEKVAGDWQFVELYKKIN